MNERLFEKETPDPAGRLVTDAVSGYVAEAKRERRLALAHRMDGLYRKAWQRAKRSGETSLFAENGTLWVPYTTAPTELGEVTVDVRVVKEVLNPSWVSDLSVEMRVADEEGTTYDTKLATCGLERDTIEYISKIPEYNSVEYREIETILAHMDGYIDTLTDS